MRAQLLVVELPFTIEGLRDEIAALVGCLPEGSKTVMYTDRTVGIVMPHINVPDIMAARLRKALIAFSNWWIVPISGLVACKNGSMDPFRHWMNENGDVPQPMPRQWTETQNVPRPQRRQIRLKSPD